MLRLFSAAVVALATVAFGGTYEIDSSHAAANFSVRHLGVSNVDAAHLAEARTIAPVVAVQNNFHVARRDDVAVLDACMADGIAFAPFFPLGGGRGDIKHDRLAAVAARHNATAAQIALAWLLALSPVTLAIPGTGSLAHLEENIAAGSITLTPEDLADLHVTEGEQQ